MSARIYQSQKQLNNHQCQSLCPFVRQSVKAPRLSETIIQPSSPSLSLLSLPSSPPSELPLPPHFQPKRESISAITTSFPYSNPILTTILVTILTTILKAIVSTILTTIFTSLLPLSYNYSPQHHHQHPFQAQ